MLMTQEKPKQQAEKPQISQAKTFTLWLVSCLGKAQLQSELCVSKDKAD